MSTQEFLLARVEALQNKVKELEAELKLEDQKRESLEWHYKLESDELKAELKLENENKRSHVVGLELQIEDLQEDNNKLVEVIKGLDPTNPILQNLIL